MLLRGAQDTTTPTYLHNSPAKSSSGNLWWSPPKTFLEEDEDGRRKRGRRNPSSSSFAALAGIESELLPSAVAPLGVTYNQNYSPADKPERFDDKTTTTTITRKDHFSLEQRDPLLPDNGDKIERCQSFHYFNEDKEAKTESICPQMISSSHCHSGFSSSEAASSKQWNNDVKPSNSIMDEDLSFMMERYLDQGEPRTHDVDPGPGMIQPSPGQQSTDSGFVSDNSHQSILTYPDQLSGYQTNYDSSFYSGFGNYFESSHNESCPMHHQHQNYFHQQQNCCCLCNNNNNNSGATAATAVQPPWESDSYNTEDLSQIVDQVLNSMDAQFCEVASNWTSNPGATPTTILDETKSFSASNVNGKLELCDNCGNMMNEEEVSCRNCGHLLQRNCEQDTPR